MTRVFFLTPFLALLSALAAVAVLNPGAANAAPVTYTLPDETAAFKPGPNLDVVQNNCTACHSADYINTQPRGLKFKKDFWQAEVTKMIKVYGAPIDDADVGKIVDYLAATY
jgi:sulfite dehydrogenase (cytochrome) subunit B